jgi:hypothetical protein
MRALQFTSGYKLVLKICIGSRDHLVPFKMGAWWACDGEFDSSSAVAAAAAAACSARTRIAAALYLVHIKSLALCMLCQYQAKQQRQEAVERPHCCRAAAARAADAIATPSRCRWKHNLNLTLRTRMFTEAPVILRLAGAVSKEP